jgi:hypothetical protein
MKRRWISVFAVVGLLALASIAPAGAEEPKPKKDAPAVQDVLPKMEVSDMQGLAPQAEAMKAFKDPVTGKLRAPEPGEFVAGAQTRTAAPAAKVVALPAGAIALPLDLSQMEFMTAVREADGSVSYRCADPAHKHAPAQKGGRNEK